MSMTKKGRQPSFAATDPATSDRMKRVRQSGTKPEMEVAAALRELGIRYRLKNRDLPGNPDFANRLRAWAVFVNGCFWHGHTSCKRSIRPKTNSVYWFEKVQKNRARDAAGVRGLRLKGFKVVIVWECRGRLPQVASKLSSLKARGTRKGT